MQNKNSQKKVKKEGFLEQVRVFISTYFLALLIRTFLIEASQIPSQSMVPSLLVGDTLMVEKVSLGTYIPVLNIKIPSVTQPKVNNMVVFVSPEWKNPGFWDELITFLSLSLINKDNTFNNPKILVKRIVAGPGDTLAFTNKTLYFNNQALSDDQLITENQVFFSGGRRQGRINHTLFEESTTNYNRVIQYLTSSLADIENNMEFYNHDDVSVMIRSLVANNFPPITIPQKGKEIIIEQLNNYEKFLLSMLIERESQQETFLLGSKIIHNGEELETWTPKDDYYFMMGDNRDYSEDSRYFGYVAKKRIYGRILFRYWPLNRMSFNVNLSTNQVLRNN